MKVRLIKERTLNGFAIRHRNAETAVRHFIAVIRKAEWDRPIDIFRSFPTADVLGRGTERVVFDLGGNNFRLIAKYRFGHRSVRLYVNWIGTHSEYDKLLRKGKQFNVSFNEKG